MHIRTIIFVAGIAAGIIVGLSSPFSSELAVAALALAAVQGCIYVIARKRETKGLALSFLTSLLCFAFFIGVARAQLVEEGVSYTCDETCTFEGSIVSSPESRDAYQTFVVQPDGEREDVYGIQVRTSLYPEYEIGEKVRVVGKVKKPDALFPHGDERSFDYTSYLHTKNVGSETLFPKIEKLDEGDGNIGIGATLGRWKEVFVKRIDSYVSSPANVLASGMLFGESGMSKQLSETFRTAGLSHIVVLSGFNIAIVIAFVLFVFTFLPFVFRVALAAITVALFVMMVGGEASVIRATLMSFIGLIAMFLGREYVARQALMLSFLAIIMYDPSALTDSVSLHLSFLATAGIIYWSKTIKTIIAKIVSQKFFAELLTTTLAAYFATFPYIMHTFGTVSPYALLANVFVLPLVPLAMLLSFATLVATFVSHSFAILFGFTDSILIGIILFAAEAIAELPGSSLPVSISSGTMYVIYLILSLLIFYVSRKKEDETLRTVPQQYLTDVISY